MKVLALIPARGGSKGIRNKNIAPLGQKPLIYYTIKYALDSKVFDEVMVSTDDQEIASIAQKYGASVPFSRSSINSSDDSRSIDCILEVLGDYKNINMEFDVVVFLQPTSPLRDENDIKGAFKLFCECEFKSVVSVSEAKDHPILLRKMCDKNTLISITKQNSTQKRQDFEKIYKVNGAIYINLVKELDKDTSLNDNEIGFLMAQNHSIDIDEPLDLKIADLLLRENI